jgi:hypothetical protein
MFPNPEPDNGGDNYYAWLEFKSNFLRQTCKSERTYIGTSAAQLYTKRKVGNCCTGPIFQDQLK